MKTTPRTHDQQRGVWRGSGRGAHVEESKRRQANFSGAASASFDAEEFPRLTRAPVIREPRSDYCAAYAQDVISREIPAGPYVRAACRRHMDDLRNAESRGLWFDHGAAQHFAVFCTRWLRFYSGQYYGQPFELHPSQEFIAGSIFGWRMYRKAYEPVADDPTRWPRRYRRAYIEMGKGNGKTPLMAAIALYGMIADAEPGAEVYIGAAKRRQAQICFEDAVRMVQASPLADLLRISGVAPAYQIDHLATDSRMTTLSKESGKNESGLRPHFVMLDELHEHPDGRMVDMLQRGFKWRRQPLVVMSTNSGWDQSSVCWEEHEHGRKVVEGAVQDDASFAYICALDAGENALRDDTRVTWYKTNPLLGHAQTEEALEQAIADAQAYPARQSNIRRLHFCEWTESETAWVTKDQWTAVEDSGIQGLASLRGRPTVLALDLSQRCDTTGLCYLAQSGHTEDGYPQFTAVARAYLPATGIRERQLEDKRPYIAWARDHPEQLRLIEGPTVEQEAVVADILDDIRLVDLRAVVYDAFLFDQFSRLLITMGLPSTIPMIEHPQGWSKRRASPLSMPTSIGALERHMVLRRISIEVNPILRAAVAGARQLASPSGQVRWDKAHSTARIDTLLSLTMAMGAWDIGLDQLVPSDQATSKRDRIREFWAGYGPADIDSVAGMSA